MLVSDVGDVCIGEETVAEAKELDEVVTVGGAFVGVMYMLEVVGNVVGGAEKVVVDVKLVVVSTIVERVDGVAEVVGTDVVVDVTDRVEVTDGSACPFC